MKPNSSFTADIDFFFVWEAVGIANELVAYLVIAILTCFGNES
jgi:hypothetical protein